MAADAVLVSIYASGWQMLPELSLPAIMCVKRWLDCILHASH